MDSSKNPNDVTAFTQQTMGALSQFSENSKVGSPGAFAGRAGTLRGLQTKKTVKLPDKPKQLSSYEICLQKYTNYLRAKKLDRCEMLIKQGSMIFRKPECTQQFKFNQGCLYIASGRYDDAVQKYLELYADIGKKLKVRPAAQRLEGCTEEEAQKFAILHNLVIAYIMRELESPDPENQHALYQLLRNEKLIAVRYT